jgi:hypothetical protein
MKSFFSLLSAAAGCCLFAGFSVAQEATPSQQFDTIKKESSRSTSAPKANMTDEERIQFVGESYRRNFDAGVKYLELAEKYPNDPIALDALIQACWQVNTMPWSVRVAGEDRSSERAIAIIVKNHVTSDKLAPLCERVSYGYRKEYEALLRAVAKSNPNKSIRAGAALGLAQYLYNRSQRVEVLCGYPALAREFDVLFGAEYMAELFRKKPADVEREVTALLNSALPEFGNEPLRNGDTMAHAAASLLHEIRYLAVGKQAPEIDGVDDDGVRFKLSDYRGMVVLLDFFSWV